MKEILGLLGNVQSPSFVPEAVAGYSAAVAHYLRRADAAWEKATAEGMDAEHLERAA